MGKGSPRVTGENVFSPAASVLEQAGGNAGLWSHMEAVMEVRAGHLIGNSPQFGEACENFHLDF